MIPHRTLNLTTEAVQAIAGMSEASADCLRDTILDEDWAIKAQGVEHSKVVALMTLVRLGGDVYGCTHAGRPSLHVHASENSAGVEYQVIVGDDGTWSVHS